MAEGSSDPPPREGYSFTIPLDDITPEGPYKVDIIKKLSGQLQKDINRLNDHFRIGLPFVKPSSVSYKEPGKICMEFIVNNKEELSQFRDNATNSPNNPVSMALQTFMLKTQNAYPQNVQLCLHMSIELYQKVKTCITQSKDQHRQLANQNLRSSDRPTGTTASNTHSSLVARATLTRTFIIYVQPKSGRHPEEVRLCIAHNRYTMDKASFDLYICNVTCPDDSQYYYHVKYPRTWKTRHSDNKDLEHTFAFQCNNQRVYLDKIWNNAKELEAHLLYRIWQYDCDHHNEKKLCIDIESVCKGLTFYLNINTFLDGFMSKLLKHNLHFFVAAVVIGNMASIDEISCISLKHIGDKEKIIHQLSSMTLDMFPSSCIEYMLAVCHQFYRHVYYGTDFVYEINFFSHFLGKLKFLCIEKCVEQRIPIVSTLEEVYTLYTELVTSYLQDNGKDILMDIKTLLSNVPVSMSVPVLKRAQNDNICEEAVVKITEQGVRCSVEMAISSAIKCYDINKLCSCWKELCQYEPNRHYYKGIFEKHIMVMMDILSDDNLCKMARFLDDIVGLFEDEQSQVNILKYLSEFIIKNKLLLFLDLYSTRKFRSIYSSISVDVFISWLDNTKMCWLDDKHQLWTKFIDVLKITADRKDVQSQVCAHFIDSMSSSSLELVSIWISQRSKFESYPLAEDVFIHNVKEALLKDTKCKPIHILNKLKGFHQTLQVDLRSTAEIVSALLEKFCWMEPDASLKDLFKPIMKHIEIWETVATGKGDYIHIVYAGNVCKCALEYFSNLAECLTEGRMSYNLCETITQCDENRISILQNILKKHDAPKLSTVLAEVKDIYESQKKTLQCVDGVLRRILGNIKSDKLPKKFEDFVEDHEKKMKELRDNDLSTHGIKMLWHGTEKLAEYCSQLDIPTQSQLFWNVYNETAMTLHSEQEPLKSDSDYRGVNSFLESILKIGKDAYNNALIEIESSHTLTIAQIKMLFRNVTDVGRLEMEKNLAKQFLKRNTSEEPFEVLKRLTEIHTVSYDIRAINSAVTALGLPNDESQHDMLIDEDILQKKEFDSLAFNTVREQLGCVFKLKEESSGTVFQLLNQIGSSKKLISFLAEIVDEDIRSLIDAVDDISDQYVQVSTVSGLIEVKTFLQPLLTRKFEHAYEFIQAVTTRIKEYGKKATVEIPFKINECMKNLHQLKVFYKNVANRGEQTKETIDKIVLKGYFNVTLEENTHVVKVSCTFEGDKTQYIESTLVDLKSRALLLMNSERDRENTTSSEDLSTFILYVDQSLEIKLLVKSLYLAGHIDYEQFSVSLNGENLINKKHELEKKLNVWEERLRQNRETFYLLNFLQSVQLHTFFKYMKKGERQHQVAMFLTFIHPKFPILEWKRLITQNACKTGSELEQLGMSLNKTVSKHLFEDNHLGRKTTRNFRESVQKGKISIIRLEETSVLVIKTVLALYENTTDSLPEPHQVLFCSRDTEWDEIQILLNRCIFSRNYHERDLLYCLANVELLPNEMQFHLVDSLRGLKNITQFLLCVVFRGSQNHLFVEEFAENLTSTQPWSAKTTEDVFRKKFPETLTLSSEISGLGKTTRVKSLAYIEKQKVVTLHISGPVIKKVLVQQLIQLNLKPYHALHLDVASVDNVISLDTFLFELLFLRCVTSGTEAFSLKNKGIYLEIANTIHDTLRNSLQTAMCFRRDRLVWNNFKNFIVSQEINSPVQVVCAYFDKLEKSEMDKADIVFTDKHVPLSFQSCRSLLAKYVKLEEEMSFVVVNSFLKVLADQLKKMSCSSFFKVRRLYDMTTYKENKIKSNFVNAISAVSKEFAIRSIKSCKEGQASTLSSDHAPRMSQVENMIRWEESNHLVYVFHSRNIQTVSAMYRDVSKVPAEIKHLFEGQMKKELEDFRNMNQVQLRSILQKVSRTNPLALDKDQLKKLPNDYVLTPDNLLKMILIVMRIRARVPVVVMGETGCGKTSLIRYLASICEIEFDVLNIHAGTELSQIISKLEENNEKAMSCLRKERWVFLDEINTSENVSVISDIICHHRLVGKQLSPNLVILSACNPYKKRSTAAMCTAGLKGKVNTDEMSKLVYRVLPLPQQLVDYVWDFGSLSNEDESLYIRRMTHDLFEKNKPLLEVFVSILAMSQRFFRSPETNYNVSLRDVQRCRTLAEWFSSILQKKTPNCEEDYKPDLKAVILAVAHCYYSRVDSHEIRKDFLRKMAEVFKSYDKHLQEKVIEKIIIHEQQDILKRMELPPGTALNRSLQENVFMILVCILNKIPIFVIGKPGCSKSLAMQVIRSNLRGKDSKDDFFKTLPQLFCVSFQGSESSTSDGILKVFEKAENYQKLNCNDVLSVVILDEIGLAEVSRFNPLKVLHSLLEPGGKSHPNVAVVGISNWALDASKMNRAIHLSRPDMDAKELFITGMSISRSFEHLETKRQNRLHDSQGNFSTGTIEDHLKNMANAYYNYCANLSFENFHGLRDYYALVKYAVQEYIASNKSLSINVCIIKGLERNFGGLPTEKSKLYQSFKENLKQITDVHRTVIELIEENITDSSARHLMLITSGNAALGILQQLLGKIGRRRHEIFLGSQFEEDLTDDYNYRILSRIMLCMEEGVVLILKNLDTIYGSLYDMLNQNYTVIGKTKICRIALGQYSNPICRVAESFRCIVLVDETKQDYQDPPFLNRFEKQTLSTNDKISNTQRGLINTLYDWIKKLGDVGDGSFDEKDIFPIFSADLLASLILKLETENVQHPDEIIRICKDKLVGFMKADAVLRLNNVTDSKMSKEVGEIKQAFFKKPLHGGLLELYEWDRTNCGKESQLRIIFTFTSVHSHALRLLKSEKGEEIQMEYIGTFKSEKQLSFRIQQFWFHSRASLLCLQCSVREDGKHVLLLMSVVERIRTEFLENNSDDNKANKHVYLILHESRMEKSSGVPCINFLSNWKLTTLDSIERPKVKLPDMCKKNLIDTIDAMRPLSNQIERQLFWSFTRIKYSDSGRSIQSIQTLMEKIKSCKKLLEIIDNYLWETILQSNNEDTMNWQVQVAFDKQLLLSSSGMVDALEIFLQKQVQAPLAKIICHLELHGVLDSFLIEDIDTSNRRNLWQNFLMDQHVFDISCVPQESGPECYECLTPDLSFRTPFFKHMYDIVEETGTDFIQTISLLKEMLVTEDKELTEEMLNHVIHDQRSTVDMILPKVDCQYSNLSNDYLEDFCNALSYSCVGVAHKDRINIIRYLVLQKTNLDNGDFSDNVMKLHSTVWLNPRLFSLEIQILGIYSEEFKLDIISDPLLIDGQIGGRSPDNNNTEESHESEQERKQNLYFSQEINFVKYICEKMLSCHKMRDKLVVVRTWSNTAGRILPLLSVVSYEPVELDMLRFCHMITEHLLLPLELEDRFLFELADGFLNSGKFFNDQVFHCVLRVIEAANGKSAIECQRVFADYMMKGLVNNPSDNSLSYLYRLITEAKLPDTKCSFLKLITKSAIDYQIRINEDQGILEMLLKDCNDSTDLLSLPFFKQMESCLQELRKQNRHHEPFVVLLIDIFEEVFMTHFKESNAKILFETAHATLEQNKFSVTYLASLGCYKAFIKSAIKDGEVKEEYCHVLNTIFTHGPLNKTLPFFNMLRGRLSSHRFCKKITQLKSKLPNLKIELSFTSSNNCLDNCPFGLKVANVYQSQEEDNYLKLLENVTTVDDFLKVYDVLFREYYVPQGFQVLNDKQNHNADLLANEIKNHKTLDRHHGSFMMCLLGRSDFKIKQFMLSPETTSRQYLINITLTLLFSMLFCYKTNEPFSLLQTCLINPVELKEMFLPGCKTSTKRQYGLSEKDLMLFTSCSCGTRICLKSFDKTTTCIACGSILKIKEEERLSDSTDEPKGFLLIEQMEQWDYEQKSLSSVACNLLFFFMKGCLLGSYAVGVSDGPTLEKVVGVPEIDIEQRLSLECHWQNLLRLLNLEDYHLFLFIHSFIFNNETFLCLNHDSLRSSEDRNKWEVNFSEAVERMVINRFELIKRQSALARKNHCADTDLDGFEACIGEMNELDQNSELTFFRMSTSASVENFWAELSCTSEFPFLKLLTQRENEINRVSSIFAIIQWHSTLVSSISYMFKSYDIFEKTVREVVQHEHCTKHRTVLENRFDALCTAWHNSCINRQYGTINWSSKMSECIILDNQSKLFQGLNFLAGIQNNIIQLAMSMSVGKSNLGLFAKSTKGQLGWQVAVPEVKVIEIKREMLINLERSIEDKILKESQCDHRYGYGRRVVYDFYEIERSLVSSVLVGKVFIKTDIHLLPKVKFSDYLFKNVAMLLSEVRCNIKQENISSDMKNLIQNKHKENPKMVPQLLIHIGMMLSLLKRTKGDSEETVKEYVNKMKNLLPSDSIELPCENLKLCHIVEVYELLEELHADLVVGGLSDKYRLRIESDDKKYFRKMAEERHVSSEVLLKALKKFIHRCLDKRETEDEHTEADIRRPLCHYLSDLSLWPDQYLSQGDIVDGEAKLNVVNLIPEAVTIGHIHELVALLREITQPNEKVYKYMASAQSQQSLTPEEKARKDLHSLRK